MEIIAEKRKSYGFFAEIIAEKERAMVSLQACPVSLALSRGSNMIAMWLPKLL